MIVGTVLRMAKRELRRCTAAVVRDIAVAAFVFLFATMAVVAGLVAAYFALETVWPPYWAAAAVAGGSLLIAMLILVIRRLAVSRAPAARTSAAPDLDRLLASLTGDAETMARTALDEAETRVRQDPAGTLATALALGVIAGLLRPGGRR